jgi:hypothetical protein
MMKWPVPMRDVAPVVNVPPLRPRALDGALAVSVCLSVCLSVCAWEAIRACSCQLSERCACGMNVVLMYDVL